MINFSDKRIEANKVVGSVRESIRKKEGNEMKAYTYLLDKIEKFTYIRNSFQDTPYTYKRIKYLFVAGKTIVRFYVASESDGSTGRPAFNQLVGEITITDEELLMSKSEFQEREQDAHDTYLLLKSQFNRVNK
jgi:hypothetical protein